MCGIYGRLLVAGSLPPDSESDKQALRRLAHRGPDSEGSWANEKVFLGNRRLSIIDPSGGDQPIWTPDKRFCIVYNGELYNTDEVRTLLVSHGHRFETRTDTEVVLHAFEQWGTSALDELNGMFAFAIWDARREDLLLARDRLGEKPLYYWRDTNQFIFASEAKAIALHPDVRTNLNPSGLANFLTFGHAVGEETMFRGISKLLPGHWLRVSARGVETRRYWSLSCSPDAAAVSEDEATQVVPRLLEDSVRRRLVADVPLGAFLSGGMDSTAIVAYMARHTNTVETFSVGFEDQPAFDESRDAKAVADHFGTKHHELIVSEDDVSSALGTLVYHYDEPFADTAGFPLLLLSRYARQHVKVVLAGDGGDELFGGYRRYVVERYAHLYQLLPRWLRNGLLPRAIEALPRARRLKTLGRCLPISQPLARYLRSLTLMDKDLQRAVVETSMRPLLDGARPTEAFEQAYAAAPDHVNALMCLDTKTWLPDTYLEKTDKATMAASLEARVPFLDHRLVEYAFRVPSNLKVRGLTTKRILKRSLREVLPQDVLTKRKRGFAVPTDPWFRGRLKGFAYEVLLDPATRRSGLLDQHAVERLWKEHQDGKSVWDEVLWALLNLELWHARFMQGSARS